ncbi:flavin reductase family protein [Mycobacterium hubeiense]|uniref:flavin reductase family protein n=1 Tax=Mycobacterium hubeiense TaxID=1867256 RepID=UPI0018EB509A|nr:flavin reductase family protein [Mycobacterium sp. QGD 101]
MYVVTTSAGGQSAGCLVGFASQVSIDPPRFLVALSKRNHTFRVAQDARHLAVHLIPQGDRELAELFGSQTGDEIDKFSRCSWRAGPHGLPILSDAAAWFAGVVLDRVDVGDHVAHVLEPVDADAPDDFDFVSFTDVSDLDPGHDA